MIDQFLEKLKESFFTMDIEKDFLDIPILNWPRQVPQLDPAWKYVLTKHLNKAILEAIQIGANSPTAINQEIIDKGIEAYDEMLQAKIREFMYEVKKQFKKE